MLVRYDPFRQLDRISGDLNGYHPARPRHWMPMDAVQHGNSVELRFDLPGVSPDSVDVTVERQVLTVSAERSWTPAEGDTRRSPASVRTAPVSRQVTLAETLDTDHLEAHFDGGVLTVDASRWRSRRRPARSRSTPAHPSSTPSTPEDSSGSTPRNTHNTDQPHRGPTGPSPFRWGRGTRAAHR